MIDKIIARLFPCHIWGHFLRKGEQVAGCATEARTGDPVHWVTCHCGYFSVRPYPEGKQSKKKGSKK